MTLVQLYSRALRLLGAERWLSMWLAFAGVVIAVVQLAEPILFGRVVDALAKNQDAYGTIGVWAAIGLFGIVASTVVAVMSDRLAHRRRLAVMAEAFEQGGRLPLTYHAQRGSGAVVSSILWGTDSLFWLWLSALREQLTAVVGIVLLIPTAISVDWRMTLILAALALCYLMINLYVIRKTSEGQTAVEQIRVGVSGRVGDVLSNVVVVQSYARLGAEAQAMRGMIGDLLSAQYPVLTWWGILTVLQRSAATIAMVMVFAVGALLASRGELTVGEIVAFVAFANLLIAKLDQLSAFVVRVHQSAPALRNFFALLDEPATILDKPGSQILPPVAGAIAFEGVSYRFPGSEQGVFDLSFSAKPGSTIALVGPTGSGKTTALSLMQRLRRPDTGRVLIDGHDIAAVTHDSLCSQMAVVFQEAGLFNRSIADNIRVGKPSATDAEVERAARLAEAHEFIMRKAGGYGFLIGERGAALSGGERQRLAIARAILKDAPILMLDEATSALDAETEGKIKRAIDALRQGRTTLIIAHRLSTVANADEILVLDQGRIVERGTFQSLVANKGLFARMVSEGGFTVPGALAQDPIARLG